MKRLIVLASAATLAACSQAEAPTEPAATEEVAEAGPMAIDGMPTVGKYKVTRPDGTVTMVDVRDDGTYSASSADGKDVESGIWNQKSPELYCETPDGEGAADKCYEEYLDETGAYMSKDPETGVVSKVERVKS